MRETKTFTYVIGVCHFAIAGLMFCFLPCYGENSPPIHSLMPENGELASDKASEEKSSKLTLPEVKDAAPTDKSQATGETEKPAKKFTRLSTTKRARQAMSSDDTTAEYSNSIDPVAHYQRARELALQKNYNAALKEINKALTQNPQYYEARYLGALIYDQQGRKQAAVTKYRQLLLYKPNYLQARISLGMALGSLGDNKAAESEYRKAIEIAFSSYEAHYNLANLLTKESRFKEALQELRICLKLSPDSGAVHNNLGVIYFHQHYLEEAEKEFRQASELEPANEIYMHNLELVRSGNTVNQIPSLG